MASSIPNTEGFENYPKTIEELKAQIRAAEKMKARLEHIRALTETLSISADDAMSLLDVPEDEREMILKRLST